MTAAGLVSGAALLGATEVEASKKPPMRCRKNATKCNRQGAAYCGAFYPNFFALCKRVLVRCCSKDKTCDDAEAKLCGQNSGW